MDRRRAVAAVAGITVVVMMATIMQALDGTIANVALPSIQGIAVGDPGAGRLGDHLLYRRSAAIATPLAGFCAARFGAAAHPGDLR